MSKILTFANFITLFRIICTILFIFFTITHHKILSLTLFFIAGISDFFDGYIARLKNEETAVGAMLDPVADKFLVISAIMILFLQKISNIPFWFLLILVIKEGTQVIGGIFLWYQSGIRALLRPTLLSKLTTTSLLIFITLLLCFSVYTSFPQLFSLLLTINTILLCGNFVYYIFLFCKKLYI